MPVVDVVFILFGVTWRVSEVSIPNMKETCLNVILLSHKRFMTNETVHQVKVVYTKQYDNVQYLQVVLLLNQ